MSNLTDRIDNLIKIKRLDKFESILLHHRKNPEASTVSGFPIGIARFFKRSDRFACESPVSKMKRAFYSKC